MVWVKLKKEYQNRNISNSTGFAIRGNMIVKVPETMDSANVDKAIFEVYESLADAEAGKTAKGKAAEIGKPVAKPAPTTTPASSSNVKKYTRKELEGIANNSSFGEFRTWARNKFKVTGRSIEGLIKDVLDIQAGKKKPEVK